VEQAEEQLSEVGGRAEDLKAENERQRAAHALQLDDETSALKKELRYTDIVCEAVFRLRYSS